MYYKYVEINSPDGLTGLTFTQGESPNRSRFMEQNQHLSINNQTASIDR
jgi:hypothetical protein